MTATSAQVPPRGLTVEDVLKALHTLDQASGADSNHFRWRVRMFLRNQEQLAERRAQAEVGRD